MSSLQEIKARHASVVSTKKITKAMQLVAISKFKKIQKKFRETHEFAASVFDIFHKLFSNTKDLQKILPKNAKKISLYVLVTSDIGLCGAYNMNVIKLLLENINQKNDKVIILGDKGFAKLKDKQLSVQDSFLSIGDFVEYDLINKISKKIMQQFWAGEINKIYIVHTEFINSISQKAKISQIFPLEKLDQNIAPSTKKTQSNFIEFEPSVETILAKTIPLFVSTIIYEKIIESKISEMASRRIAMENASDTAEEIIEDLNLQFNRSRQAAITQEILEIVSGVDQKQS